MQYDEFWLVWSESKERWYAFLPGSMLTETYPSVGAAAIAVLRLIGASESGFDVEEDTGRFYRYVRSEDEG